MSVLRGEKKRKPVGQGDDLKHIQQTGRGKVKGWRESGINAECIGQGHAAGWE